ncbi:hypothetical protein BO70DRAFT_421819, partial [Aspergillus heteromorphus CBS 117.55]
STYDHRVWRTGLPVRSAVLKPHAGRLVVGWVTTSESLLFVCFCFFFFVFWEGGGGSGEKVTCKLLICREVGWVSATNIGIWDRAVAGLKP